MSFFKDLFAGKKAKLKTPEERKAASIQRLKKEGIPYIEHLPVIESVGQVRTRSLEEIARRATTSLLIIQAALDIENNNYNEESRHWLQDKLQQYGGQEELTPKGRAVHYHQYGLEIRGLLVPDLVLRSSRYFAISR